MEDGHAEADRHELRYSIGGRAAVVVDANVPIPDQAQLAAVIDDDRVVDDDLPERSVGKKRVGLSDEFVPVRGHRPASPRINDGEEVGTERGVLADAVERPNYGIDTPVGDRATQTAAD